LPVPLAGATLRSRKSTLFPKALVTTSIQIPTSRLILVGADAALLRADRTSHEALARAAHCTVPANWPPEHHDQDVIDWVLRALEHIAPEAPWRFYYIQLREPATLIGTCGFKQAPDASGCVEVGYSVLAQFQGRGIASEAVKALMRVAFEAGAAEFAAETFPSLPASLRVMEKCGMSKIGAGAEPGTVRYSLRGPFQGPANGKSTFAAPGC
jgi:RimJ/RimL family protein N-acetyltransferase